MQCRSCSADIADKAIVCYRCGTPTADPAAKPARLDAAGRRWWPAALLIALVAAAAAYLLLR